MKTIVYSDLVFSDGEDAYTVDAFVGKLDYKEVVSRIKELYPDASVVKISFKHIQGSLNCSIE